MIKPSILPSIKYLMDSVIFVISLSISVLSDGLLNWRLMKRSQKLDLQGLGLVSWPCPIPFQGRISYVGYVRC